MLLFSYGLKSRRYRYLLLISLTGVVSTTNSLAQLLEPRLLTNVPIGTNFLAAGYSYSSGKLLVDPSLPVDEDLTGKVHGTFIGYVRSIRIFKESGKVGLVIPYASGNWDVITNGADSGRQQNGLGDIGLRLSYNFTGSPAMRAEEYRNYKQNIISGVSLQMFLPTGAYDNNRLINIGSNRFRFRTVLGASKKIGNWILESYGTLGLYLANNDFLGGNKLTQRPLAAFKVHVIRMLPRGNWITLDGGYGFGGRSYINGEPKDVRFSTFRFGVTLAIPFKKKHSLRLAGYTGRSLQQGPDFDGLAAIYQYRWNDK